MYFHRHFTKPLIAFQVKSEVHLGDIYIHISQSKISNFNHSCRGARLLSANVLLEWREHLGSPIDELHSFPDATDCQLGLCSQCCEICHRFMYAYLLWIAKFQCPNMKLNPTPSFHLFS